jgi:hypothetical protein
MKKTFKKNKKKKDKFRNKSKKKQKFTQEKENIKHIYIKNKAGFGNKVFDLIFAIYLYNLYNQQNKKCKIHYVLVKSHHDKPRDPLLNHIFPKSNTKINYITEREYENITYNSSIKINKLYNDNPLLQDLKTFPKYEDLEHYNKIDNNFRLVYEMYKTFSNSDKAIFKTINNSLITQTDRLKLSKVSNAKNKKSKSSKLQSHKNKSHTSKTNINTILTNITKIDYVVIHIRYGDKFYYLLKDIDTPSFDMFLLYTPEYYIDMIKKYLNMNINMKIIILTDSIQLVKEFIINNTELKNQKKNNNYENIILLDTHWLTSFYILLHAKEIVMSCSTFSMCASYFNENAKCHIVLYHDDHDQNNKKNHMAEEYAIAPNWIISHNKNYVLNYNKDVLLSMVD